MWATALKVARLILVAKDKKTQNLGKKIVIVLLSPIIALVFLIGGIFSDGVKTNHNIIQDLFNGVPISQSGLSAEQVQHIQEIESGMKLINIQIDKINEVFEEGKSLDTYLVKGYFIGIMFTDQKIVLDEIKAEQWVLSFTNEEVEEPIVKRVPTSESTRIFNQLDTNLEIKLSDETKEFMQKIHGGLIGNTQNGTVTTLTKEEIKKLIDNLPKDTSELRKNIIIQAADAVGKIPYYWGGYATVPGYEGNNFGVLTTPDEHGRILKGVDCSHFIDWVYWTVMGNNLGNTNTTGQVAQSTQINKEELLPGDLAFLMESDGSTTHVGIYAGKNEKGELVWIHENAADVNVAMNTVSYWNIYYRLNIMKGK